jgi:ABC-type cobalamin/Fe3+-siderophores transport system ATPase subunit
VSLAINKLSFGYGQKNPVIEGLDLEIPSAKVTALLGTNGAGKTTLIRLILGLLTPWQGTIALDGQELTRLKIAQRAKLAAYVPQFSDPALPGSALEIVLTARFSRLSLGCAPKGQDWQAAEEALDLMGIKGLSGRPFMDLSGGEKRKVLIARALAQKAKLLVLDEPTASLDPVAQIDCLSTLRSLAESGLTIVMTTHFPDHALWASDIAALLKDGSILSSGPSNEVMTPDNLTELYGRPFTVVKTEKLLSGRSYKVCLPLWGKPS